MSTLNGQANEQNNNKMLEYVKSFNRLVFWYIECLNSKYKEKPRYSTHTVITRTFYARAHNWKYKHSVTFRLCLYVAFFVEATSGLTSVCCWGTSAVAHCPTHWNWPPVHPMTSDTRPSWVGWWNKEGRFPHMSACVHAQTLLRVCSARERPALAYKRWYERN